MELTGINIDVDLLRARGAQLAVERQALAERIWTICGEQYEISNPHKKRQFLFGPKASGGQGLMPLSFTEKTHTPQLNTAVLEFYAPTNELAHLFLEWAEKEKLIGTFIEGLEKKLIDGRLHTSFNQHRTVTGRLSSNNPNLQQIPRGGLIRDTFISDEDHVLVVADYDQVELRCAAALSCDAEMIRVFREGQDIHTQAAAAMYAISPDDVDSMQRQVGKTMNFGTLYGAGPTKVATVAETTIENAQAFIRRYYEQFSGLSKWKDKQIRLARATKRKHDEPFTVIPPWGRKRRLPDLFSQEPLEKSKAERQVINSIVQGFASNIMKLAMIDLHKAIQDTPFLLLLNVHDELILQSPKHQDEDARLILVTAMEGVTYKDAPILGPVPLTVDAGIAHRWSEAK
jgi:DNA polymerase-1